MSQGTQISMEGSPTYATRADFCRIFSENMNSLHLLALLLTGEAGKAEQCFVTGIDESIEGNTVFREWAYSWARRTIIQCAIRIMEPAQEKLPAGDTAPMRLEIGPRLKAILKLELLDRFVFVMSVLEGYSYHDCSLLLGCSRQAIVNARARALEHLAKATQIATQSIGLQIAPTLVSQ